MKKCGGITLRGAEGGGKKLWPPPPLSRMLCKKKQEQTSFNDLRQGITLQQGSSKNTRWFVSHYDFRMGCDPPFLYNKGGHTPFWNRSERWTTLLLSHQNLANFFILRRRSLNKVCSCFSCRAFAKEEEEVITFFFPSAPRRVIPPHFFTSFYGCFFCLLPLFHSFSFSFNCFL